MIVDTLLGRAKKETGYLVPSIEAIEILSKSNTEAANWWRENTPERIKKGRLFLFNESVCEKVSKYR